MNRDYIKLRILLQFFEQKGDGISVTSLAKMLGQGKTYISKLMHEMEDEGLLDLTDSRRPYLTQEGRIKAESYSSKVNINLNHLLYEGVNLESAKQDAYIMALYCSDATNYARQQTDQLYRAKRALRDQYSVNGAEFCRLLADGQYSVPFFMYKAKERAKSSEILSMANAGFEQPCHLQVKDSVGTFHLRGKQMVAVSRITGLEMRGKVDGVKYLDGRKYSPCEREGDVFSFPAEMVNFQNISAGGRQILHGFIRLAMRCDVGIAHMPESVAVCIFIL